ncbi:chitin synthase chs-2-like [Amblyraja radiata]|uniref:chitin synthase chs-2-like n=1 Tax=Amblyraja radiata TaxID=386614 RepID=UPI00140221D5|nr:chitin synthase chs-2-like [Amblyraja radiata]
MSLGLVILFSVLTSLTWWENFISNWKHPVFRRLRSDVDKCRNVMSLCISVVRTLVTACVVGAWIPLRGLEWATITDVASHELRIILGLLGVQAGASVLCSWFGGVACKIHAVKRSFGLPLILNTPVVLAAFLLVFSVHYNEVLQTNNGLNLSDFCASSIGVANNIPRVEVLYSEIIRSICNQRDIVNVLSVSLVGAAGVCWWVGLILTTIYVWTQNVNRIQRTSETFVRRMYEAAFLEQSMLLNTRLHIIPQRTEESDPRKTRRENLMIYICATLWHETAGEMLRLISSLFRLDRFREKRWKTSDKSDDSFDFEVHVIFDDAFKNVTDKEAGTKKRVINEYVESLISAIDETYRIFQKNISTKSLGGKDESCASGRKVISTPYGGRLCYTLPCGNVLHIHLKDTQFVQNRKRWSQVMCMYYLLGWRLYRKHFVCQQLHPEDVTKIHARLETEKKNTYILTLDGDTEFQPSAVTLLIDRLRRYPGVGAACGRIHPTGFGPMVWYQKFEYAVSHWLQKTAEHVLGSVLCSPGCFSLFRAAALMDENVVKKFAMKPTTAVEHLQFDQGEDRWLSLLLLQQGWRIEYCAGSDSYTNAPRDFKEFFNQRRRWDPSKIANAIELLGNGFAASRKNPSVSKPFLLYQILYLMATLVGPSTVCFLIAAALSFFTGWNYNWCLIVSMIPPIIYLIICYTTTPDTQITVTAAFTVLYTLAMIGGVCTAFSIIISDGTIVSPIGIFITALVLLYFITALLHPNELPLVLYGLLYLLCIPTASMLQPIYSLANLHVTSWGTRETRAKEQNGSAPKDRHLKYKIGRWYLEWVIHGRKAQHPTKETIESTNETDKATKELDLPIENRWVSELNETTFFTEDSLEEDETLFWSQLIQTYLQPVHEDAWHSKIIQRELLSLKDKAIFLYLMINVLWLGGTFLLQLLTDGIVSPKIINNGTVVEDGFLRIQPVSFAFLATFAVLIFIQFVAMLYHRIYTFIHLISHSSTNVSQSHNKDIWSQATEDGNLKWKKDLIMPLSPDATEMSEDSEKHSKQFED